MTFLSRWYHARERALIRHGVLITDSCRQTRVRSDDHGYAWTALIGKTISSGDTGAWQGATDGMSACRKAGLPFQIHTTVMDWNMDEVEKLTDFAVDIGAIGHHIFFLVPTGRAVDIEAESLRAEQYEVLLRRIMKKQADTKIELKPTCAPQFMRIAAQMNKTRFSKGCWPGYLTALSARKESSNPALI